MALDPAAALGGPAAGAVAQATQNEAQNGADKENSLNGFPSKMSQVPAWCMGQSLGGLLSDKFLENDPAMQAAFTSKEDKDNFKKVMQSLMSEVTKSMSKSTDYLKELDDDEEKCAATQIYNS